MSTFRCHDCGAPIDAGEEIWQAPHDGVPDEAAGEPYCAGCAAPVGLAA